MVYIGLVGSKAEYGRRYCGAKKGRFGMEYKGHPKTIRAIRAIRIHLKLVLFLSLITQIALICSRDIHSYDNPRCYKPS